jgi:hypothetical protein
MKILNDAMITDSWTNNTDPWTVAVRSGEIESRRLVTNQAIIDAVRSRSPRTGIDIGCGEGWLVRALECLLPAFINGDQQTPVRQHSWSWRASCW